MQPRHLLRLASAVLLLLALAPSGSACESCRQALASEGGNFAAGLNASILFMLTMVVLIPAGFGLLLWHSYRSDATRKRNGEAFQPAGKLRWHG